MDLRQPETWKRHQLAATERMQSDIGRFTRPVIDLMCGFSMAYLMSWGMLCVLWGGDSMPWAPLLIASISALVVVLALPAFVLAVGIESYFSRRLRSMRNRDIN
ncbi:hypothetical protein CEW89_17880 [Celeribacter ethanolicus]|uniref:Uncharacterized protein n=1 Tax=Celeribacter ethanolicus TaxID=1758178 RepID=A0A291GGR3_9RHOB|nr:hypothetical protein CEW89_17880 [Celeribacter ethanolicus]